MEALGGSVLRSTDCFNIRDSMACMKAYHCTPFLFFFFSTLLLRAESHRQTSGKHLAVVCAFVS